MVRQSDRLRAGRSTENFDGNRWRGLISSSTLLIACVLLVSGPLASQANARADARGTTSLAARTQPGAVPQSLKLVIATTTDTHGRLRGWDYYTDTPDAARGLSRAATIVDSLRQANPSRVVLVDAGDLLQGNPLTDAAQRNTSNKTHPVIAAMNVLRYDAAAVGNHEFNYGGVYATPVASCTLRQPPQLYAAECALPSLVQPHRVRWCGTAITCVPHTSPSPTLYRL